MRHIRIRNDGGGNKLEKEHEVKISLSHCKQHFQIEQTEWGKRFYSRTMNIKNIHYTHTRTQSIQFKM